MDEKNFSLTLTLDEGYRMTVDFGGELEDLLIDEPPPVGRGAGPNPVRLLASSVGGCLGASLLFCLRRARADVSGLSVHVKGQVVRTDRGHWRVAGFVVTLRPELPPDERDRLVRCIPLFEDFCIVSESVRRGIPVEIQVEPRDAPARLVPV